MTGIISGIKRMEIHDGDGLRTTVFFKGCTLKCIWCHNPEGISFEKETAFFENKCLSCGGCLGIHSAETAKLCPSQAILTFGEEYSPTRLFEEVIKDAPFFKNSGGGVTFSGGECLAQSDFTTECAKLFKENGISVFIDTCGFVPFAAFEKIIPYTDKFLYDIKAISPDLHKNLTGQDNSLILENFKRLIKLKCDLEVRYPLVAGYNDIECDAIGNFLKSCGFSGKIKILRYHSFSASRYKALGMENTLPNTETLDFHMNKACEILLSKGLSAVTQ